MATALDQQAAINAQTIAKAHGIPPEVAFHITKTLWADAMEKMKVMTGEGGAWHTLTQAEKATMCSKLIMALLDKNEVMKILQAAR